jgi:lysophospholipase L1-like esterase
MHPTRSSLLMLALIVSTACRPDGAPSAPPAPSTAALSLGSEGIGIFQRYVAIGTSISMGVQSDGVYDVGQRTAWPVQLAAMAHRTLTIPLIQSPGCQSPLVGTLADNHRLSGEGGASSEVCAPNEPGVVLPAGNVSISAALTSDALNKTPETAAPTDWGGGRIYARVLAPGQSQVTAMLAQNPKVVSVELGANELLKARGGLVIPGVTVVPYDAWERAYDGVIDGVKQSHAKYVVLVGLMGGASSFPAFRTGAEMWDARAEFQQFYVQVSENCEGSENLLLTPILVPTIVGQAAQAAANRQPMPELSCADVPGTVDYVLTPDDRDALTAQLRQMSARIRSIAADNGYAYFDLDALYGMPGVRTPFSVATLMFSTTPFGPYISLDGFHPSAAGQTVFAQAAAQALNSTYRLDIPLEIGVPHD